MPLKGYKLSEEHKLHLSESHKGKSLKEEHKNNISKSLKGKTKSEKHKKNIKLSENSGRIKEGQHLSINTEFKIGQLPPLKNKKRTKENIEKQKETIKNRTYEEKIIISKNKSEILKGKHNSIKTEWKKGEHCGKYNKHWNGGREAYLRRRRSLGFILINNKFLGSEGHHLNEEYVLFIPKELHRSIIHNVKIGYNMEEINNLAIEWYFKGE